MGLVGIMLTNSLDDLLELFMVLFLDQLRRFVLPVEFSNSYFVFLVKHCVLPPIMDSPKQSQQFTFSPSSKEDEDEDLVNS